MRNEPANDGFCSAFTDEQMRQHADYVEAILNHPNLTASTTVPVEAAGQDARGDPLYLGLIVSVAPRCTRPGDLRDPSSAASISWQFRATLSDPRDPAHSATATAAATPTDRTGARTAELPWPHPDDTFRMAGRLYQRPYTVPPPSPAIELSQTPFDSVSSPMSNCRRHITFTVRNRNPFADDDADPQDIACTIWSTDPHGLAPAAPQSTGKPVPAQVQMRLVHPSGWVRHLSSRSQIVDWLNSDPARKNPYILPGYLQQPLQDLLAADPLNIPYQPGTLDNQRLNIYHVDALSAVLAEPRVPFLRASLKDSSFFTPESRLSREIEAAAQRILADTLGTDQVNATVLDLLQRLRLDPANADEQAARRAAATVIAGRLRDRATINMDRPVDPRAPLNAATRAMLREFQNAANGLPLTHHRPQLLAYRSNARNRQDETGRKAFGAIPAEFTDSRYIETDASSASPTAGTLSLASWTSFAPSAHAQEPVIFLRLSPEHSDMFHDPEPPTPETAEQPPVRPLADGQQPLPPDPAPLHVLGSTDQLQPVPLSELASPDSRIVIHCDGEWLFRGEYHAPEAMREIARQASQQGTPIRTAAPSSPCDSLHDLQAAIPGWSHQDPSRSILAVNQITAAVPLPDSPGPATEIVRPDGTPVADPSLLARAYAVFVPYDGDGASTFEDSTVISESFARALTTPIEAHLISNDHAIIWTNDIEELRLRDSESFDRLTERLTEGDIRSIAQLSASGEPRIPPGGSLPVQKGHIIRFGIDPFDNQPCILRSTIDGEITAVEHEIWEDAGAHNGWARLDSSQPLRGTVTDPETESPNTAQPPSEHDPEPGETVADGDNARVSRPPQSGDRRVRNVVTSRRAAMPGDKIALQSGCKFVISAVLPDHRMPAHRQPDGSIRHADICVNPFGIADRNTLAPYVEASLHRSASDTVRDAQRSLRENPQQAQQDTGRMHDLLDLFTTRGHAEAVGLAHHARTIAHSAHAQLHADLPEQALDTINDLAGEAPEPGEHFSSRAAVTGFLERAEPVREQLLAASPLDPASAANAVARAFLAIDPDAHTMRLAPETFLPGHPEQKRIHELVGYRPGAADHTPETVSRDGNPYSSTGTITAGWLNVLRTEHHAGKGITVRPLEGPWTDTGLATHDPGRTPQRMGSSELRIIASVDPSGAILRHLAELSHADGVNALRQSLRDRTLPHTPDTGRDTARLPANQLFYALGMYRAPSGRVSLIDTVNIPESRLIRTPDRLSDPAIFGATRDQQVHAFGYISLPHPIPNPLLLHNQAAHGTAFIPALLCTPGRKGVQLIERCAAASDYHQHATAIARNLPTEFAAPARAAMNRIPPAPGAGARWLRTVLGFYKTHNLDGVRTELRQLAQVHAASDGKHFLAAVDLVGAIAESRSTDAPIDPADAMMSAIPVPSPSIRRGFRTQGASHSFAPMLDPLYETILSILDEPNSPAARDAIYGTDPHDQGLQAALMAATRRLMLDQPMQRRPQPPIINFIAGKHGAIARNETGFRCTNSGRAVITCNPDLPLGEIRIPWTMASQLYEAPAIGILRSAPPGRSTSGNGRAASMSVLEATALIRDADPIAIDAVRTAMRRSPVLLGRQPTIHFHNVQCHHADISTSADGKPDRHAATIQIHPLSCSGYGADFDGDKMWCIPMLDPEAAEAAAATLSPQAALRKDGNGEPLYAPTHEAAWGLIRLFDRLRDPDTEDHARRTFRRVLNRSFTQHRVPSPARRKTAALLDGVLRDPPRNKAGITRLLDRVIAASESSDIPASAAVAVHDALNRAGQQQLASNVPGFSLTAFKQLENVVRPLCDALLDGTGAALYPHPLPDDPEPLKDCRATRVPMQQPLRTRLDHCTAAGRAIASCAIMVHALSIGLADGAADAARDLLLKSPYPLQDDSEAFRAGFRKLAADLLERNPEAVPLLNDIATGTRLKPVKIVNLVYALGVPLNAASEPSGEFIRSSFIRGITPRDASINRPAAKAAITNHQQGTSLGTDIELRLANATSRLRYRNTPCDSAGAEVPLPPRGANVPGATAPAERRLLGLVAAETIQTPSGPIEPGEAIRRPQLDALLAARDAGTINGSIRLHGPASCTAGGDHPTTCSRCTPLFRNLPDGANIGPMASFALMEPIIQSALSNKHTAGRNASESFLDGPSASQRIQDLLSTGPGSLDAAWPDLDTECQARPESSRIPAASAIAQTLHDCAPPDTDPVLTQAIGHALDTEASRTGSLDLYRICANVSPAASASRTGQPRNAMTAILSTFRADHDTETLAVTTEQSLEMTDHAFPGQPRPGNETRHARRPRPRRHRDLNVTNAIAMRH